MAEFVVELTPQGDAGTFHTSNLPDEDFRRVLAQTPNNRSPLTTRIKLAEVHHGNMTHEGREYEATLLILEFRFQSRLQKNRYEAASVTLEFLDKVNPGKFNRNPMVHTLAPDRVHWLNKTTFDKSSNFGATLGINPTWVEAGAHWEVQYTKPTKFKATLTGYADRTKDINGWDNAVTWTMEENQGETDGVPSFLQTAVLLRRSHSGPFSAQLRVDTRVNKISMGYRLRSTRTDKDKIIDPITIDPSVRQVQNNSVTGIGENELSHMEIVNIAQYLKVNLSEEDHLLAQERPRSVATELLQPLRDAPVKPHIPAPMTAINVAMETAASAARVALKAAEAAEAAANAALLASHAAKAAAETAELITSRAKAAAEMVERAAGAGEVGPGHTDSLGTDSGAHRE
ncbi:hypothetical protein F5Y14DRAFT_363091 [Nemania sp. NC0429]|nr:hypothetical protein F5Y14DRAFT_363091 [Nemania sp. NC0429]